ncbi:hypothetical protein V8C86DRAFT_2587002 [Haematococcus lacustris]
MSAFTWSPEHSIARRPTRCSPPAWTTTSTAGPCLCVAFITTATQTCKHAVQLAASAASADSRASGCSRYAPGGAGVRALCEEEWARTPPASGVVPRSCPAASRDAYGDPAPSGCPVEAVNDCRGVMPAAACGPPGHAARGSGAEGPASCGRLKHCSMSLNISINSNRCNRNGCCGCCGTVCCSRVGKGPLATFLPLPLCISMAP